MGAWVVRVNILAGDPFGEGQSPGRVARGQRSLRARRLKKIKILKSEPPTKPLYPGRTYIGPPPPPPFLAKRHFQGRGGGGVYFEAPRGRNFIRPPPFIHPPPLGGYISGYMVWGILKVGIEIFNRD